VAVNGDDNVTWESVIIDGVWIGEWIYWRHRNYNYLQRHR
jgi:hypothetical protein